MQKVLPKRVSIIGGGPAGLMAAERLAEAGMPVTVFDRMPSAGRKFMMAGRGGLNLTHTEDLTAFLGRYGPASHHLAPAIAGFPPDAVRAWCERLGQPIFVGTSGRVFPKSFKASPLLRAWLGRLNSLGVTFHFRHLWRGWSERGELLFDTPEGQTIVSTDATILALGGGSWPRLGSDGRWVPVLNGAEIAVVPLKPSNCGFDIPWSQFFRDRFAGQPIKTVCLAFDGHSSAGDMMLTARGIEGGPVYALSARLRERIASVGSALLSVDLRPGLSDTALREKLKTSRGSQSLATFLKKATGLSASTIGLLQEVARAEAIELNSKTLPVVIKALPLRLISPASIERAISTAGGVSFAAIDPHLMLSKKPGTFVAGEMIDWEAPTGGYLLQACFSTGVKAAEGVLKWLQHRAN